MKNSDFLLMFVLGLLLCNTQVLGDIPVGEAPSWMKFSPDGEYLAQIGASGGTF